jgi:hypothetical protein
MAKIFRGITTSRLDISGVRRDCSAVAWIGFAAVENAVGGNAQAGPGNKLPY